MNWQAIETARLDHQIVQGWSSDGWIPMMFLSQSGDWKQVNPMNPTDTESLYAVRKPTHWAPIPDGPHASGVVPRAQGEA